ncbi:MAG: DUF1439 domain-containing protein [Betaproteobacteria bacterium HGW-Betaproteobacteria-8]|nr:MAG: DUF1439 domain-containing protein [Betaproteobacteria bacterium HGW-Betaproteobacteria-8]
MPRTSHTLMQGLLPFLLVFLSACAASPRTVSISESDLQRQVTEELSVPITLLRIFDVNLSNPVIRLDEGTERLHAQLDTEINNPLSDKSLKGTINISGKLRFDATKSAVMLSESRIEQLDIKDMGLDDKYSELFNVLAARIGAELLNNVPIYTFKPDDLKVGGRHYVPSDFRIVGRDLKVTLQAQ